MHETMVAENILRAIVEQAEKIGTRPLSAVISCGQFNTLNDEIMQFAFDATAAGTVCEGMTLKIKHIPLRATCRQCKLTFEFDLYNPHCPGCRREEFDFEPDAPLLLEEIEFEEPK